MIENEVNSMDEQNIQREEYTPRPKWQVWLARAAAALLVIGIIGYYYFIAKPY